MASPTLLRTPGSKPTPLSATRSKAFIVATSSPLPPPAQQQPCRRNFLSLATGILIPAWVVPVVPALAASDEEYVKETGEVIDKIRSTINMEKNDPNVATAVAELRETSNSWVAKYRREKTLLGRTSFRDIYSALNAVSGHYISFGPTAPIPAKRKARILEEMDSAEKALLRGR
ncbi:photosystem II repair protein PSB27-H1, chloroplastic [Ricinus communis]|uniref:Photosystem II 11 kDa protein, putative n=1 Tax=Ricinus communis TaxID=3988 RepID=B9RG39_RICCO|nr:photosystem II repair protein PSB27-H1, chloroplastic [Ricinus communis]EEF50160.1 Photosystem II 11 kDa protein precursor, putative [Ricinus communis]|eukprot:XP_002512708.1 photosystem II repair protein PSB27-H1, chloroplastic [Ricinus communis]